LYKFIVESRCVRITDLQCRFPEEFTEAQPVRGSDENSADENRSEHGRSHAHLGRLSQRLSDALQFLLAEEVVVVNRRGRLVHVNAWKEKKQIRIERAFHESRGVGAN
jgi:hypothetical protein